MPALPAAQPTAPEAQSTEGGLLVHVYNTHPLFESDNNVHIICKILHI